MTLRRPFALLLAVAFAALARAARADDAQTAAIMQAVGQAGAGGAAGAAGGAKKKDEGGGAFARPLTAPQIQKTSDGAKKHGKAKKSSGATNSSKYKSNDLAESSEHTYRFNDKGEPLSPTKKKSSSTVKKKTSSADDDERKDACSADEPCAAKKSDGDAF